MERRPCKEESTFEHKGFTNFYLYFIVSIIIHFIRLPVDIYVDSAKDLFPTQFYCCFTFAIYYKFIVIAPICALLWCLLNISYDKPRKLFILFNKYSSMYFFSFIFFVLSVMLRIQRISFTYIHVNFYLITFPCLHFKNNLN